MSSAPIFLIVGSPGSGKSTLSEALMKRFEKGVHLPVDDLREWVASGLAHPLEWTEETTQQFGLAIGSALDIAMRYSNAGFAVAIDHCHNLPFLDHVVNAHPVGGRVIKILLLPGEEACIERNQSRTNKQFDPAVLEPVIRILCREFDDAAKRAEGWLILNTCHQMVEESVDSLFTRLPSRGAELPVT